MDSENKNYLSAIGLSLKSKEDLISLILKLQKNIQDSNENYINLRKKMREAEKKHEKQIEDYQKQIDYYLRLYAESDIEKENYKKVAELKLGKAYNINASWIDKIVFILKEAGRPLRSSEIIEIMTNNDIAFRTLSDKQKALSPHLNKAMKYGRIIGERQKGQNGYLFHLPSISEHA